MECPLCHELERALQVRQGDYDEALASAHHRVNVKFAAYKRVELECARNELEEHRLVCASTVMQPEPIPIDALSDFVRHDAFELAANNDAGNSDSIRCAGAS
jgi:hypothetical protein